MAKLLLDSHLEKEAHAYAHSISTQLFQTLWGVSTTSIERATLRLMGCVGDLDGHPAVNIFVDALAAARVLNDGSATWLGRAMMHYRCSPAEVLPKFLADGARIDTFESQPLEDAQALVRKQASVCIHSLLTKCVARRASRGPVDVRRTQLYCLTATGNVHEDATHLRAAASSGADIIAIIRSTAQSLYDFVPEGLTTEGFGGTFATQANFALLRSAADAWATQNRRYLELSSFCSGLCMPEIAAIGAIEQFDNMVNDALYGILYRDINSVRTLVDQKFSRAINGYFGIRINTGEDNYLRTEDRIAHAPNVLASQLINYHTALAVGLTPDLVAVGNAFEVDPELAGGLLYEIAFAQLTRDLFPQSPVKFMPPTRHMTGDVFRTHAIDQAFNLVTAMTEQGLQTTGALTEGLFTPHIHDRAISVSAAAWIRKFTEGLAEEIAWRPDGHVQTIAQNCLRSAVELLAEIAQVGLLTAIEAGVFGGLKRDRNLGHGIEGVFAKTESYFNPVEDLILCHK